MTKVLSDQRPFHWLNRNVLAFGLTSFFSDFGHEMATSVLAPFLKAIGASAASLGFIEGTADAFSSFLKLGAGFHSDRLGRRKGLTAVGYFMTSAAHLLFVVAMAWPIVLIGRLLAWTGRGIRGPLRDAMLADSIAPEDRGKAFGFHRAGDTLGAVVGPLTAFGLLTLLSNNPAVSRLAERSFPHLFHAPGGLYRVIFLVSLIPGILAVAALVFLTREKRGSPNPTMRFWGTLRAMPRDYRRFLLAVGLFGMGDFAPSLMILRATAVLSPRFGALEAARWTALLYTFRNLVYAMAAFPIGALSHRFSRTRYLAVGYALAVVAFLGLALAIPSRAWFALLFGLAGVFIAWEDTMERVAVRDYVSGEMAGTGYGLLGAVNGIGDFVSSAVVGLLYTLIHPAIGFLYAAAVGTAGTLLMALLPSRRTR